MQEVLGYPWCEERGRLGVDQGRDLGQSCKGKRVVRVREVQGREESGGVVRVGPQLNGNFKGDMQGVLGYPWCEERGRLGVGPRSRVMPPQGPKSRPSPPRGGVRMGTRYGRGGGDGGKGRVGDAGMVSLP